MIQTGRRDLVVPRWTPFRHEIDFQGLDLTGGTFALQVRLYRDAPGDPLISLAGSTSPAEGMSVTVGTQEVDGIEMTVSTLQIRINETTIEGVLPFAVTDGAPNRRAGDDVALVWDLHITATGLPKTRILEGAFTIKAGVTQ
jgi:hypothetical protein